MASIYRLHRDYSDIGHLSSKYGDVIAEKTGLGRTWVGVILMASVTSLPELVTGISSATIFNVPDIAAGDVLGSCMFNILILAIDDLFYTKGPTLSHVSANHLGSSSAAIGLTYRASKKWLFFAWDSMAITAIYVFALSILYIMR